MSADNRFNEALPEELKAVEIVLRRLTPTAQGVDRDRVMYLAGRASVASRQRSLRSSLATFNGGAVVGVVDIGKHAYCSWPQ